MDPPPLIQCFTLPPPGPRATDQAPPLGVSWHLTGRKRPRLGEENRMSVTLTDGQSGGFLAGGSPVPASHLPLSTVRQEGHNQPQHQGKGQDGPSNGWMGMEWVNLRKKGAKKKKSHLLSFNGPEKAGGGRKMRPWEVRTGQTDSAWWPSRMSLAQQVLPTGRRVRRRWR